MSGACHKRRLHEIDLETTLADSRRSLQEDPSNVKRIMSDRSLPGHIMSAGWPLVLCRSAMQAAAIVVNVARSSSCPTSCVGLDGRGSWEGLRWLPAGFKNFSNVTVLRNGRMSKCSSDVSEANAHADHDPGLKNGSRLCRFPANAIANVSVNGGSTALSKVPLMENL